MHDAPLYNNQPEFIGAVIATPRTNIYQNPNSRISRTRKTGLHPHTGEADMIHHTASRIIVSPISCFTYPLHQAITIRTYKTKHGVTRRGSTCCFPSTEPHLCHIDKLHFHKSQHCCFSSLPPVNSLTALSFPYNVRIL